MADDGIMVLRTTMLNIARFFSALGLLLSANARPASMANHVAAPGAIDAINTARDDIGPITVPQDRGTIRGVVRDTRLAPMRDVSVTLEGTDNSVRTGADGKFEFRNLSAGPYQVMARRVGMAPDSRSVAVRGNNTVDLAFVLTPIRTLDTSRTVSKSLFHDEFDERRARGMGYAVDSTVLNHRADLFSALSHMPLTTVARDKFGGVKVTVRSLGERGKCVPLPYLDGRPTTFENVTALDPSYFRAIEVLPYEVTPAKYLDGRRCVGAILFWSKKVQW